MRSGRGAYPCRMHGSSRLFLGAIAAVTTAEVVGVVTDGGRRKPLLWHDLLTERKHAQMCALAARGGADVVFIGCSHTVLGIDAEIVSEHGPATARPAFNAALYRAMPQTSAHWLESVVLPLLRPRLVIWGLSPLHFNDNGVLHREIWEKYSRAPAHRAQRPASWAKEVFRRSTVARLPVMLTAGRRRETLASFRAGLSDLTGGRFSVSTIPGELGSRGLGNKTEHFSYATTDRQRYVIEVEALGDYRDAGVQAGHVESGIQSCRRAGAEVVLLRMPMTDDVLAGFVDGRSTVDDADRRLAARAADWGVPVLDVTKVVGENSNFADFVHLNGVGRRLFSIAVASHLEGLLQGEEADLRRSASRPTVIKS